MRESYDFSKSVKNPYAKHFKSKQLHHKNSLKL